MIIAPAVLPQKGCNQEQTPNEDSGDFDQNHLCYSGVLNSREFLMMTKSLSTDSFLKNLISTVEVWIILFVAVFSTLLGIVNNIRVMAKQAMMSRVYGHPVRVRLTLNEKPAFASYFSP